MPLVSVVMPAFNRAHCIQASIESVLKQTHTDLELLVVDDGSSDDTAAVVRAVADQRLRYLPIRHQGVSAARNAGLQAASGAYVSFCDSDDLMYEDALAFFVEQAQAHPEVDILYADAYWENIQAVVPSIEPQGIPYAQGIQVGCMFCKNDPRLRFDPAITAGFEEWDLLLRLFPQMTFLHLDRTVIFINRTHHDHLMGDKTQEHIEALYIDIAVLAMHKMVHGRGDTLVVMHCTRHSVLPSTYVALNHLRAFFTVPFDVVFDVAEAAPATGEALRRYGYRTFTDPQELGSLAAGSVYQRFFSTRDDLLVTKRFRLPAVIPGQRSLPAIVPYRPDIALLQYTSSYQPNPIIVESFTSASAEARYDQAVFWAPRDAFLDAQAPSVPVVEGSDLLEVPGLNKII